MDKRAKLISSLIRRTEEGKCTWYHSESCGEYYTWAFADLKLSVKEEFVTAAALTITERSGNVVAKIVDVDALYDSICKQWDKESDIRIDKLIAELDDW